MARPIEVPVVVKKDSLRRSIEGEATAAMRKLGGSSTAVQPLGKMLGKIRADADEFTKSIEASNARVIAFGASVGVINGISNAFKSLVATTIKVEKSMADINIVLGASEKSLAKFGDGLFKVAKNTAQSFEVVTEAATEFARQGLNIEETLKRTNDALILTRLTGLKAADSVKGLTAAVNGFGKAGLTTTQIINKLSAVDVKFAVGTDDLINALGRAGAVAQDAGVNFDELVALVTVAQQKTARGGAVIGNAFKTIYTRMQDPRALQALRQVGVAVDDVRGAALPANRVLQNLAQTYDSLNRSQKATLDQFVAGKFQINILKSVLGDLNTVNGEYARAQQVSINATDQAIQKNDTLNKTMAALATQSGLALDELAKKVGDLSLGPGMKNILQSFNALVEGATKGLDGEGTGSTFAKGLLRGIGGVLTGPGLFIIGGVFIKLFKDLTVFGVKSLKNLLGLNNASKQQAALQQGIGQLLATNVKYQTAMVAAEGNIAKQAAITQRFLASEVVLRERAAAASAKLAASAYAGGFGVSAAGVLTRGRGRSRGKAPSFAPTSGAVPNFAFMTMGRMMSRLGTARGAVGEGKGGLMASVIGTGAELGVLGAAGRGPKRYNAGNFSKTGVREVRGSDLPEGDVKASLIGGGSGFQWTKKGKKRKDGTRAVVKGQGARFLSQGAISITPFTGFRDAGKLSGALKKGGHDYGISAIEGKLERIMAGQSLGFGREGIQKVVNNLKRGKVTREEARKQIQGLRASARDKERLFEDVASGGGGVGAQIREALGARGRSATPARAKVSAFDMDRFLLEYFKNMGKSMGMKGGFVKGRKIDSSQVDAILGHSSYKASGEMSRQAAADAMNTIMPASQRRHERWMGKGYTPFVPEMAPNFAPYARLLPGKDWKHRGGKATFTAEGEQRLFAAGLERGTTVLEKGNTLVVSGAPLHGMTANIGGVKNAQGGGFFDLRRGKLSYTGSDLDQGLRLPNFSPLSDAVRREKTQVGSMMGISPSSVQTRVVQNSSLQSPFNPQGFGVISPTVGQHSFSDAARMHKGENLRTTNLPNFAFGDVLSTEKGKGMTFAKPSFEKIIDPGATGTMDVKVVDHSEKALKSLEKAYSDPMERRSRLEKGTRLGGMTTVAGDVADPRSAGAIRRKIMAPIGAAGRGLGAIGGAAMGPAFTAMMMGEMLQGFNPPPTASQRFGMTAGQRVNAGRANRASQGATWGGAGGALAGAGIGFAVGGPPGAAAGAIYGALGGTGLGALGGYVQGGSPYLTNEEREQRVGQVVEERQTNLGMVDQARSAMLEASSLRSDPQRYKEALSKARNSVQDITDPDLKLSVMTEFNRAEQTGFLETGIKKMGAAATTGATKMSETITGLRGGSAIATLITQAGEGDLTPEQKKQFAAKFAALPVDEQAKVTKLFQGAKAAAGGVNEAMDAVGFVTMSGMTERRFSEDLAGQFESLGMNKKGAEKMFQDATRGGVYKDFLKRAPGQGAGYQGTPAEEEKALKKRVQDQTATIQDYIMLQNQANQNQNITTGGGGPPDDPNVYKRFLEMQRRLRETQITNQQAQAKATAGAPARQLRDQTDIGISSRIGGQRATIGERYRTSMAEANIQAGLQRQELSTQYGGKLSAMIGKDIPTVGGENEKLISALTEAFESGDISKAQAIFKDVDFDKHTYDGKKLEIASMLGLEDLSKQLDNAAKIVNINIDAQENYIEAQKKTAEMLDKNGVLIAGIEGFKNSLQDAFMSIADPSLSGGDIARNFTMGILGSIQQQASSNVADFISGSLFGDLFKKKDNQSGGIIGAQNGMYISGSGTGDKYPALLENKEYVLNRKAVEALGGPATLDAINFGIAPRFSPVKMAYGGVFGGVRSKARNRAVEKFGWASMGPTSGGSALGGGGMSLGLDYFDSRLSSRGRDDPTARAIKGYFREDHQKQIAKKFQKQANEDALKQAIVGAAVSAGLSYGVGKLGAHMENSKLNKQALADESEVFGGDFDFSPLHTAPYGKGTGGGGTGGGGTGGGGTGGGGTGGGGTGGGGTGGGPSRSIFSTVWDKVKTKGSAILEEIGGQRLSGLGSGIGAALGNTAGDKDKISAARVAAGNAQANANIAIAQANQAKDLTNKKKHSEKDQRLARAYMAAASNLEKVNEQGKLAMAFKEALNPLTGGYTSGATSHLGEHAPAGSHPSASLLQQFREATGVKKNKRGRYKKHTRKQFADYLYELSEQFGGGRPAPPPPKAKTTIGTPDMSYLKRIQGIYRRPIGDDQLGPSNVTPVLPGRDKTSNTSTGYKQIFESKDGLVGETHDGRFLLLRPGLFQIPRGDKPYNSSVPAPRQRGGSIDSIPAMLTGGEFVMNAGAVRKYGSATLGNMNRFQTGGIVGPQKFVPGEESSSKKQAISEPSTNNNTVNISVNMGNGGGGANVTEDAVGTNLNTANGGRELGAKIKKAVLGVIEEEKRVGGRLRNPYAKDQ